MSCREWPHDGRECSNLAHHFELSRNSDYAFALQAHARTYFEDVYDARFAARLHQVSCARHAQRASCASASATKVVQH
jgi:hypothetical protein